MSINNLDWEQSSEGSVVHRVYTESTVFSLAGEFILGSSPTVNKSSDAETAV